MALTDIVSRKNSTTFARGNTGSVTALVTTRRNVTKTPLITSWWGGGGEHSYIFF